MFAFQGIKNSYFAVLAVNMNAFLTGASLVWSSPIIAILQSKDTPLDHQITSEENSWIGSLSAIGGVIGPPVFGYLSHTIGRKWANTLVAIPFMLAFLVAAFAEAVWPFYISRIFMGIGIGGVFTTINLYVVEVSDSVNRGLTTGSITTFIMAGSLFAYAIAPFVSIMTFNLILVFICVIYVPIFLYVAPETPYYLISVNQEDKALKSLQYLRGASNQNNEKELEQIKTHMNELKEGSFLDIFRTRASVKAFAYGIILTTFQQFSGINVILFYTQDIFDTTGSEISSAVSSIIVAAVQLAASFVPPLAVDRFGRRKLFIVAITGATAAEFVLGIYFYLQKDGHDMSNLQWLSILSLVVFIMFYNFGMGSFPWIITSEILPSNIVSKAAATATSFYWFTGFFLTRYFADLSDAVGMAGSFWLFAGFGVLFWLFVYFFMFETSGKSLEEIQEILNK